MKKLLAIGINYKGTEFELGGCINDANDWAKLLGSNGFDEKALLLEQDATRNNIVTQMSGLVNGLAAGDVGFITYSGHGTWVPDKDGDEPDGRDEAICPIDMGDDGRNLLIDDDIHKILNNVAAGAYVVLVTDSCHSGTVFRFMAPSVEAPQRVRFIPPSHFIKEKDLYSRMERSFGQRGVAASNAPLPGVIHFSGCGDTEYSNDAVIRGRPCGAFSYFAVRAFEQAAKTRLGYANTHKLLRQHLPSMQFQQTPKFNAPAALKDRVIFT